MERNTAQPPPFAVTTQGDDVDGNLGDGTCDARGILQGCTLRAAIQETNALDGDREIILEPGTFVLNRADSGASDEDFAATGDLDVRANLTFAVAGNGTAIIRQDANARRVFQIHGGATVAMRHLVVEGVPLGRAVM